LFWGGGGGGGYPNPNCRPAERTLPPLLPETSSCPTHPHGTQSFPPLRGGLFRPALRALWHLSSTQDIYLFLLLGGLQHPISLRTRTSFSSTPPMRVTASPLQSNNAYEPPLPGRYRRVFVSLEWGFFFPISPSAWTTCSPPSPKAPIGEDIPSYKASVSDFSYKEVLYPLGGDGKYPLPSFPPNVKLVSLFPFFFF